MATFGIVLTTPGEIADKIRARIVSQFEIAENFVEIAFSEQAAAPSTLKVSPVFVQVIVPEAQSTGLTESAGTSNMQMKSTFTIRLYTRNQVGTYTSAKQATLSATSGFDPLAALIHSALNLWFPEDGSGNALVCQPLLGQGWRRANRQDVDGYTMTEIRAEALYNHK
jgi:hypothetical protein